MATSTGASDINPAAEPSRTVQPVPVVRTEHAEDFLTRMIEHQAARIPSHLFLLAAFGAMSMALVAEAAGKQRQSRFVGMWVGPLLTMGVYNKIVKTFGAR